MIEAVGILKWNLNSIAVSMHLSPAETLDYFTDGCRVSFILERRICREIIVGRLAPNEAAGFDLIDAHGRKWEVRWITRQGVYFRSSYMVGSGRKFDEGGLFKKLHEIEGYVISDVTKFPEIPVRCGSYQQGRCACGIRKERLGLEPRCPDARLSTYWERDGATGIRPC